MPADLRSVPTAMDAVLHPVLAGPPRPARVLAATRAAAYVELGADHGSACRLVAILTPAAARVPAGVLPAVDSLPLVASLRPGDGVRLGSGALVAGGLRLVPVRWWDSRVSRLPRPAQAVPPSDPHLPELPDAVGQAAWALAQALAGPASERGVRSAVSRLVGLGPGLTPAGDDVLAGALVALSAAGDLPRRTALAAAVRPLLGRTSTLSAAYLRHAAEGRAMPELARFLAAVAGGRAVGAVVEDLLRVGASSGVALASGAVLGLRAAAGRHRPTSVEVA